MSYRKSVLLLLKIFNKGEKRTMNRKSLLFVLSLLVVGALLASCAPAAAPAPAAVAPRFGRG